MLGTFFLKSFNVASLYCDKTHCKSSFLYWILEDAIMPWSKGWTTLVTFGRKEYQIHGAQFQGWKTMRLTNFGRAKLQMYPPSSKLFYLSATKHTHEATTFQNIVVA